MGKGRKPIPTALKVQRGTLEKSRLIPNEWNPQTLAAIPEPRFLSTAYEMEEWQMVCAQLIKDGLLIDMDTTAIEMYCKEIGKYREASDIVKREGFTLDSGKTVIVHPAHLVMERSLDRAVKIGVLFGLTPSARTKISAPKAEKKGLKHLLNGTE